MNNIYQSNILDLRRVINVRALRIFYMVSIILHYNTHFDNEVWFKLGNDIYWKCQLMLHYSFPKLTWIYYANCDDSTNGIVWCSMQLCSDILYFEFHTLCHIMHDSILLVVMIILCLVSRTRSSSITVIVVSIFIISADNY